MDDNDVLSAFRTVKRKACASYSMICLPDSEYAFSKCSGLSCFCNLWQTHCKCRVKLG
ncbi:hypothetical protein DPMN_050019 [Dreissena polymorpha]|uniref:Uncharacterized protein n=1 Tax=Dreissena polymorpha TaxID=45954 RepID=A0A9D4CH01_DREPO|nr:hypothetical protein DPMN_050019 [Dreissena polymorpha]